MKKKRLYILLAVVAAAGIAALVVSRIGSKESTFPQDYHIEDVESVTKIFMADKQNSQVTLQRAADSTHDTAWTVDGLYPASQPMVDLLLQTLHDMRIRQGVNKGAVPTIVKHLSAGAVKVEVYQRKYFIDWFGGKVRLFPHERLTVTYYVGHETQDMMACYMFRKGDKVPYIIHIPGFRGYLTPRFNPDPVLWRSHAIVHWNVKQLQSVQLDILAQPEESFIIRREGDGFGMELTQSHTKVNGFDTARVAQMLSCFANLNFDEFASAVPNSDMDSAFARKPRAILRIANVDGTVREVKTFLKYANPDDARAMPDADLYDMFDMNRLYALIDNKDSVLIQYFVFDNILQPASYFLGKTGSSFAKQ